MNLTERIRSFWREDEFYRFSSSELGPCALPEATREFLQGVGVPTARSRFQWSFRFPNREEGPEHVLVGDDSYVVLGGSDDYSVALMEPTGEVYVLPRKPGLLSKPQYANQGICEFVFFLTLFEEHQDRAWKANYERKRSRESADAMMKGMNEMDPSALRRRHDFWRTFLT